MQAANLKDQKKQRGMVVAKEEGANPDGRPSAKTPRTEEDLKETQSTSEQPEVSMSQSARFFYQTGNQPLAIQRNHHEKWPTESSSDSENESKGDHSAKVP
ncbi:uncharacterized protein LOC124278599 [Haliotis rubra]|uniref:uncharacterized protein LOC124278599 n=1 Tax=Haliotis rubra TaxID=36100 RepID=UPI001EE5674A|nr:uncharacterized protein LOC124278599 [Haliotis rubra]